ncbi:hypothetical protein LZ31DRAFT_261549 [Colletotrichum somersetense]|nr:hypothetical protein LZ31DRAFT_261549 [Colletotrichum somersetense]
MIKMIKHQAPRHVLCAVDRRHSNLSSRIGPPRGALSPLSLALIYASAIFRSRKTIDPKGPEDASQFRTAANRHLSSASFSYALARSKARSGPKYTCRRQKSRELSFSPSVSKVQGTRRRGSNRKSAQSRASMCAPDHVRPSSHDVPRVFNLLL